MRPPSSAKTSGRRLGVVTVMRGSSSTQPDSANHAAPARMASFSRPLPSSTSGVPLK